LIKKIHIKNISAKLFLLFAFLLAYNVLINSQSLQKIKEDGKIRVAFTESGLHSVNYKFALEFAKFLNVEIEIVPVKWDETFSNNGVVPNNYQTVPQINYVPDALRKADFICGTIYQYEWRKKFFDYAGNLDLSDLLIIPADAKNLKSYDDLKGLTIAFLEKTSYETHIEAINNRIGGGINFVKTKSEKESIDLLKNGVVDGYITIAYNALETIKQSKDFKIAFPVAPIKKAGWAVRKGNTELKNEINNFFETIKGNGKLNELFTNYYGIDYDTYYEIISSYSQTLDVNTLQRDLDEIIESGKLIVALRDRLMVYSKNKKQFNTYLAEEFAKYLGVELEIKFTPYFSKYFEDPNGEILKDSAYTPEWFNYFDVACEIMVPLDWRRKKVNMIPFIPYAQVVIGRKNVNIHSLNDLKKYRGVTSKGSAQEDILINNNINNYYYSEGNNFLHDISTGKADYAIGSDAVFQINQYSNLEAKFVIGQVGKDGWAIKKNQPKLRRKILEFIDYANKKGLLDKYFKLQTGMKFKSTENYLTVLQETYQPGVFPFVFYGTKEGLPQEDILSIFQDKDNYMWFGTHAGAVKYNGREMHVYNKSKGFKSNSIFDITQDKDGLMYFSTLDGVAILEDNKISNIFTGYSFRKSYIDFKNNKWFFGDNGIAKYSFDGEERILNKENLNLPQNVNSFTMSNRGISYIASKEGFYSLNSEFEVKKISNERSYFVFIDEDEQLWLSTANGVYIIELEDYLEEGIGKKINDQLNLPENTIIKSITQTKDGIIWLVADDKIFQLITLQQKPIIYDENIGLEKQRILSFIKDREENFWIGYSGGIQKLTNKSLRLLYPNKVNSYISSIIEDDKGRIWLSMNKNVYVLKENLENYTKSFNPNEKSFVVDKLPSGNIIVASNMGIYEVDTKNLKIIHKNLFPETLQHLENIFVSSQNEIFLLTGVNGNIYYLKNFKAEPVTLSNNATSLVYQLVEFDDMIVGGNRTGLVYFNGKDFDKLYDIGDIVWSLHADDDVLWVGTDDGLGKYTDDEFEKLKIDLPNHVVNAIKQAKDKNYLWMGTNGGFAYFNKNTNKIELSIDSKDGLQGNEITIDGLFIDERGLLWIGTYHGISTFDIKKNRNVKYTPEGKIERITLNGQEIDINYLRQGLSSNENNLTFELTGISFKDEKSIEYEFFMKGLENDYGASRGKNYIAQYPNLPPGKYVFNYRTKGNDGIWSYYKQVEFRIDKPIWLEWWFILSAVLVLILLIFGFVRWRNLALQRQNEELERIVKARTVEIVEKNEELMQKQEEILAQRDEIEKQKNRAELQRDEIAQQQKEITDSIHYASRIQRAILPPKEAIASAIPQHFILYLPRDIVSGDYYWFFQKGNKSVIVAADCTGHGVPGAFMSMLGSAFLNEIVTKTDKLPSANETLNELRRYVISSLHQTGGANETRDGMDIAICIIDFDKSNIEYAGAFNSLYQIRDNELIEFRADRMPIGVSFNQDKSFVNHLVDFRKDDTFYIFSDGFIDQFGGTDGKKFKSRQFKNLILSLQEQPMDIQEIILHDRLLEWRGDIEQIDDILVIGFKL
jgi:ligand-binding sensor domain-containing protein/serine phosphatase RsbU (regulator of sigma subunit)/ABC-type amino acid transport substrate-binding protein